MHTARVRALPLPLLAALLALAAPARAQQMGHLDATGTTSLSIAREELDLDCAPDGERDLVCAIVVRWEIVNDADEARTPELGFGWIGEPTDVEVRVADAVLATALPRHRRVRVVVPAQGRVVLEVRARQQLFPYSGTGPGWDIASPLDPHDALSARHPLLAQRWEVVRRGFPWRRPSPVHFESIGPTTIRVRGAAGWQPAIHADHPAIESADGEARVFTWSPGEGDRAVARALGVELARGIHTDVLRHGGPFLALGGTIDAGLWGRIGYEIGLGEWVLVSVAADTDFVDEAVIAPLVEIASYSVLVGPSLSIGVGVPVRVAPDVRAGVRIEASATFYAIAFVASFDVFPDAPFRPFEIHLLGRIGL